MPPRESSPQFHQSFARSVQARDGGIVRDCHHSPPAAAIRLSKIRLAGREFVLRSVKSCSTAKGRPPRPRSSWATDSNHRTARNARGPRHAAGCSAATGFLRALTSLLNPARQNGTPTWLNVPEVQSLASSGGCRSGPQRFQHCRHGQTGRKCPRRVAF